MADPGAESALDGFRLVLIGPVEPWIRTWQRSMRVTTIASILLVAFTFGALRGTDQAGELCVKARAVDVRANATPLAKDNCD